MADLTGVTKYFPTAHESFSDNLSGSISALAVTVPVTSATEYTDGVVVVLTVDPGTANEATFTGTKASAPDRFINCVWTEGNLGVGHTGGATVIDYQSATHFSMMSKGIKVEHKDSGAHGAVTADSLATTSLAVSGSSTIPTVSGNVSIGGTLTVLGKTTPTGGTAPRISVTTSTATLAPNIATANYYRVSAQAEALAISNPIGTPSDGEGLLFEITGTAARTISWGSNYEANSQYGLTLPTTTVTTKTTFLTFVWSTVRNKWLAVM